MSDSSNDAWVREFEAHIRNEARREGKRVVGGVFPDDTIGLSHDFIPDAPPPRSPPLRHWNRYEHAVFWGVLGLAIIAVIAMSLMLMGVGFSD